MTPYFDRDGVTLYHGDCLEILPTLADASIDAVITDPPFGIGYLYGSGKEVADDPQEYGAFLLPRISLCKRAARPGAFFAVWQSQPYSRHFWTWFGDGIHVYAACKNFVQLRKTPVNYGYDPVVMWYASGTPLRPEKPARNIDFHVANTAAIVSNPDRIEKGHPCPRPLDTVAEVVGNFSLPGGLVLDPFTGSGTTAVACIQAARRFIGIELDEKYCDIAVKRIEAEMAKSAIYPAVRVAIWGVFSERGNDNGTKGSLPVVWWEKKGSASGVECYRGCSVICRAVRRFVGRAVGASGVAQRRDGNSQRC